jgi:hypothetical protein
VRIPKRPLKRDEDMDSDRVPMRPIVRRRHARPSGSQSDVPSRLDETAERADIGAARNHAQLSPRSAGLGTTDMGVKVLER